MRFKKSYPLIDFILLTLIFPELKRNKMKINNKKLHILIWNGFMMLGYEKGGKDMNGTIVSVCSTQ